jgi:putative transcriptional regulator
VHNAAEQLLIHHAAGALDAAGSLLAAAYREVNSAAAVSGRLFDRISSHFLDSAPPETISPQCLNGLWARLEGSDTSQPVSCSEITPEKTNASPYPCSILPYLSWQADGSLPWKAYGSLRVCNLFKQDDGTTFGLVAADPGKPLPQHTHRGEEFALVLKGTLQDERGTFERGDMVYADASVDHKPMAVGDKECVCLVLTRGKLKFTGRYGGVLNLLQG